MIFLHKLKAILKTDISAKLVITIFNVVVLVNVWSDWTELSSCSLDGRGICSRNRTRTCLNETCSSDQAVSMGMVFRMNDTEIVEKECNYSQNACKGNRKFTFGHVFEKWLFLKLGKFEEIITCRHFFLTFFLLNKSLTSLQTFC